MKRVDWDFEQWQPFYFVVTSFLPFVLLYPALMYAEFLGMGGYDGFIRKEWTSVAGVWAIEPETLIITRLLSIVYYLWFVSIANLPLALIIFVYSMIRKTCRSKRLS